MVILHIAYITDNKANGVSIVVPKYVEEQSKSENVGLLNISDYEVEGKFSNAKIFNSKEYSIELLEKPFNNPDLVIFHEIYRYPFIKIYKELKKNNIPYIIIPHGSLNKKAQAKHKVKKVIGNILLFKTFVKKANNIQFLSEKEKNISIQFNKNAYVLGNGTYIDEKIQPKEYKKNQETFKYIYIGRFDVKIKGLDILLKACNKNKEFMRKNNIELLIYGKDSSDKKGKKYIKKYIEKYNIEDIVKLNAEVYGKEKVEKLIDADIFVQASRTEGQPLSVLEALGYGKPVIVTPGTNLSQIVEEKKMGWESALNIDDLAKKMQEAYNISKQNTLNEYSTNARNYIRQYFMWEKITKKALSIYAEIIDDGRKKIE